MLELTHEILTLPFMSNFCLTYLMIRISLKICLVIVALLGSIGSAQSETNFSHGSNLKKCSNAIYVTRHNCFGSETYDGDEKYIGEFKNGKRHGQGTYTWPDGEKYVGGYRDNQKHGYGIYIFPRPVEIYVGGYRYNKKEGFGTYYYNNGDIFFGLYERGDQNGQGTYIWADGTIRSGIYKDDKHQYDNKNPNMVKLSTLKAYFNKKPVTERKLIQSYLKRSGLYDANVDGFFGMGTSAALQVFNKQNLNGNELTNNANVNNLLRTILTVSENKACSSLNLKSCSNAALCSLVSWSKTSPYGIAGAWQVFVLEAKNRGLNCDVKVQNIKPEVIQTDILPACPSSGYFHNCSGTKTYASGDKYVGEFKDDKANGQGIVNSANGDKYVGEFKDDYANGQGTYTYANGDTYVGEYKDGKRNGQGTFTFKNGNTYVGEFKDNNKSGQGTETFASGATYVGGYKDGKRNGQGTYTYTNGDTYVGEYKDNNKSGQGTETFTNGDTYVGEYKDGKRNGQGTFTFKNGNTYVGEFKDNNKSGQGTETFASGATYVGGYKDGKRNGQGTYTYTNGTVKEGIWKDDNFLYASKNPKAIKPKVIQPVQPNKTYKVASGTGFYVSDDGHIITNHHVIDGCKDMKVHSKGRVIPTLQIADDKSNDLALLKISESPSHVFALSGSSPFPLQEIIVAGFPFSKILGSSLKFTQGIVSSLTGLGNNYSEIQIDAALQQGNSGGPIIDEYGNIVAVAVSKLDAKYMFEEYGVIPENTNFGVRASAVKNLMEGNGVPLKDPNKSAISRKDLSQKATDGTVYLTCWMTTAQIETMRTKKVLFEDLN